MPVVAPRPALSSARRLPGALFLALGILSLVGCAFVADDLAGREPDDSAWPPADCASTPDGDCGVTGDGCDPREIFEDGSERCARCAYQGEPYDICGAPRTARCFVLDHGAPCERCVTDEGEVLYDDCATRADDFVELSCEAVAYEGADLVCEVCRDDHGVVVRESCRPNASHCEDRVVNGRACRECYTDEGDLAYRECQRADIDPVVCEAYGSSVAQCIDCYGANDELLSHECSMPIPPGAGHGGEMPMPGPSYCDSVIDPSGRSCTSCYSAAGDLVEEHCDDVDVGRPARCEQLAFLEQTCFVCVDDDGQESSTQCSPNSDSCRTSPIACPAPPPCENRYRDDGALCRTCVTSSGESETLCMSGGGLVCETEQEFSESPSPGRGEPALTSELCTVCRAPGMPEPVYRACSTDGTVPPQPVCSTRAQEDGSTCEICVAPGSAEEVYSTCRR